MLAPRVLVKPWPIELRSRAIPGNQSQANGIKALELIQFSFQTLKLQLHVYLHHIILTLPLLSIFDINYVKKTRC